MRQLQAAFLAGFFFFSTQAFSGEFSPGYAFAHDYFDPLTAAIDKDFDNQLSYNELINGYHARHLNKDLYQTIRLFLVNFDTLKNALTGSLSN